MTAYQRVHYPGRTFPLARADRLELVARCYGLSPPPAPTARVLEIGCGTGVNLLAAAEVFPGARFVGVDLAPSQIAAGHDLATRAGLGNVELLTLDLADLDERHGSFDYILAHGVFSWVAEEVRARLLEVVAARLAPGGVAFISHDVKPGWYGKAAVREMLFFHLRRAGGARRFASAAEVVAEARSFLTFVHGGIPEDEPAWRAVVEEHLDRFRRLPDEALFHDYLSPDNEGFFLHEMVAALRQRGLAYLADASMATMVPSGLDAAAVRTLSQLDPVGREQYLDFIKRRAFRATLVVHEAAHLGREPSLQALRTLRISSSAVAERDSDLDAPTPTVFRAGALAARVSTPRVKRALATLRKRHPASVPMAELAGGGPSGDAVVNELFGLAVSGLAEVWLHPDALVVEAPERPRASSLARAMAEARVVPNLRHEMAELEPGDVAVLPLLDGTRDLPALAAAARGVDVGQALDRLGHLALLLAEPTWPPSASADASPA